MPYIIIKDDNEGLRSEMRQQMRNNGGVRRMNMREHSRDYEQAYRDGYESGWKDHEREMREMENETMIENRRGRYGR